MSQFEDANVFFENLFVLEMANNRGRCCKRKKLIKDFGAIARHNVMKVAIKLQFRKVDDFVHPDFKGNKEIRYISKTEATKLEEKKVIEALVNEIKNVTVFQWRRHLMNLQ